MRYQTYLVLVVMLATIQLAVAVNAQSNDHPPAIRCVAFSPDGKYFAACSSRHLNHGKLAIWDTDSWALKHSRSQPVGFPRLTFSPDSQQLALSRFAPETQLFDVERGVKVGELKGHANHARCAAYTPDGTRIVTGSYDRTVMIWDATSHERLHKIDHGFGKVYEVGVSPDGKLLAIADADSYKLHLIDMDTLEPTFVSNRMGSLVPHVSFSPDGSLISASSWGGYSRHYDVETMELKYELNTNGADWTCFSPDGTLIAVAAQLSVFVYAFPTVDDETEETVRSLISQFQVDDYQDREDASRKLVALGGICEPLLTEAMESRDPEVRWRTRRLRKHLMSTEAARELTLGSESECVAFSPDGTLLVAGDKQGNIVAWNVSDWTVARRLTIPNEDLRARP